MKQIILSGISIVLIVSGLLITARSSASGGNASVSSIRADSDGDGVEDARDNCPNTYNPEKIVFTSRRDGFDYIFVMNADGSNVVRLSNSQWADLNPSFSKDGSKIVFYSVRDGNTEIYVMNSDGSNQTRLTSNTTQDLLPSFSPDGSKIVFYSDRDNTATTRMDIYVMNSNGTGVTRLTDSAADDQFPSFSPDGSKIVFASNRFGPYGIFMMNADGTNQVQLTHNDASDFDPSFSPDGSKIVYTSHTNKGDEIYVMNSNGTNQTRLTDNTNITDQKPSFSPDGSKIIFTSNRSGDFEIYMMDTDGGNVVNLTNNPAADVAPSWTGQLDSDGDGVGDVCENTPPMINGASISVAQNAVLTSQQIATVSDNETPANNLTVSIVGTLPNGISVGNIGINTNGAVTATVAANCSAALGANTVKLQVSDGEFSSTANLTINITPSNPAVIVLKPFAVLSPPDHKLQTFSVSQMVQSATDDCSGDVSGNVTIEKAASDEAVDALETGSTAPDIILGEDCRSVSLRAERSGIGNGRVYTITLKVVDSSGNTTRADYKVFVPRGSQPAIEDAAAYTVNGSCP